MASKRATKLRAVPPPSEKQPGPGALVLSEQERAVLSAKLRQMSTLRDALAESALMRAKLNEQEAELVASIGNKRQEIVDEVRNLVRTHGLDPASGSWNLDPNTLQIQKVE